MAAIRTQASKQGPRHVGLWCDWPGSWQDLGHMETNQQETLDQFLRDLYRRVRPGLPCSLLLGHRYQTLARSLDQALPYLRKKRDHSLRNCRSLRYAAIRIQQTGKRPDDECTATHLSALLCAAGKSELQLAPVFSVFRPVVSATDLAHGSQEDIPENLNSMESAGDPTLPPSIPAGLEPRPSCPPPWPVFRSTAQSLATAGSLRPRSAARPTSAPGAGIASAVLRQTPAFFPIVCLQRHSSARGGPPRSPARRNPESPVPEPPDRVACSGAAGSPNLAL